MIGGLYENAISKRILGSTVSYYDDDFTWCVAKAKFADKWMNVFIVFDGYVWAAIFLISVVTAILLELIMKAENIVKENFSWYFLITFSLSISNYVHFWPKRSSFQILAMGLALFGIVINGAYHSALLKILKEPRYEMQVDNVEAALAQDFTFTGGENIFEFLDSEIEVSR